MAHGERDLFKFIDMLYSNLLHIILFPPVFFCLFQQYCITLTVRQDSLDESMNESSVVEPQGWPQSRHGKQVNSRENRPANQRLLLPDVLKI